MKIPRIANAVGHIDEDLIAATEYKKAQHNAVPLIGYNYLFFSCTKPTLR